MNSLTLPKKVILSLLQLSKETEYVALEKLAAKTQLSIQELLELLDGPLKKDIEKNSSIIHITKDNRINLINKAIDARIDLDHLVETLHWREFEKICLIVFEYHDFYTIPNFRFSLKKRRFEIDVVSLRTPLIFAIDAKKWKSGRSSGLKPMVKNHIQRVTYFANALKNQDIRKKLLISQWQQAIVIPLIVTSRTYDIQIFQKVPIIPFFRLNQFINDYSVYLDLIFHLPINLSAKKSWDSKNTLSYYFKSNTTKEKLSD